MFTLLITSLVHIPLNIVRFWNKNVFKKRQSNLLCRRVTEAILLVGMDRSRKNSSLLSARFDNE